MTRPIQPSMTDERLDRLVRLILSERAEDVAADALPVDAMAERITTRLQPSPFGRTWVLLAAALLTALLIGGALVVGGLPRLPSLPPPTAPPASAAEGERVRGWPDTTENQPGVYSWDGSPCGMSCNSGFMHNGYGSGNLEIRIEVVRGPPTDDGATAVTVAGHSGMYRRIDAQQEEWIVDIEGTTIAIRFTARPGTSQAELAEAYAIIGSMRTEPQDTDLGFRLVFTLTTNNWDSG
jgi:hypothetical protein